MVNTVPSASDRSGENAGETLILTIINAGGPWVSVGAGRVTVEANNLLGTPTVDGGEWVQ